jgi:hypothetical protein
MAVDSIVTMDSIIGFSHITRLTLHKQGRKLGEKKQVKKESAWREGGNKTKRKNGYACNTQDTLRVIWLQQKELQY